MAKIFGGTVPNPEKLLQMQNEGRQLWAAGTVKGMNSTQKPYNIDNEEVVLAQNVRFRYDTAERRAGVNFIEGTKPDSNRVLATMLFKTAGSRYIYRFTKSSVYKYLNAVYTAITGTLSGVDTDRIQATVAMDKPVFANNGVDKIQLIDTAGNTFADLSTYAATKYRYVTVFNNRVVGANEVSTSQPTQIGWSAEYPDIDEWDPSVNIAAGFSRIIDNPTDESDDLTGIFGLDDVMIVLREKSVLIAVKQAIASNPFYFRTQIPDVGCDAPWSAHAIANGVVWADSRTRTIWHFNGESVDRIGIPIELDFWSKVTSATKIYGGYDPDNQESHFILEQDDGENYEFILSWRGHRWSVDYPRTDLTCVNTHPYQLNYLTYDELVGTYDSLSGTYDDLGVLGATLDSVIYGRDDGEILFEDVTVYTDVTTGTSRNPFETILESKVFTLPSDDIHVAEIRIYYDCISPAWIYLDYNKDMRGWVDGKSIAGADTTEVGDNQFIRIVKNIRCRTIQWRFRVSAGTIAFGINNAQIQGLRYEIHVYRAGESKR